MANELRVRQIGIGGLIETAVDNDDTTLVSAGLAAVSGGIGSTQHLAVVFDPDGIDGAPEIVYVTALTNGASSGTIARGQEGTTARPHAAGIPWIHAPTLRDVVRFNKKARASGNVTLNSVTWANVDTGLDIVVPAFAGDILEAGLDVLIGNEAVTAYLDVQTIVGGTPTNSFGQGGAVPSSGTAKSAGGWFAPSSSYWSPGAPLYYTVVAGDLESGLVTCRLRYIEGAATNRTFWADGTNYTAQFAVKNLGPAAG